jgi:hypothetical protein
MAPRWRNSFAAFLQDMGPCPPGMSIYRIDNNRNYTPKNCRWATPIQQSHNSRRVRLLTLDGVTLPLAEWARVVRLSQATIWNRLKLGWNIRDALCPTRRPRPAPAGTMTLEFRGGTLSIAAWAQRLGLSQALIRNRLKKGWPVEMVLSTSLFRSGPPKGYVQSPEHVAHRMAAWLKPKRKGGKPWRSA